MGNIDTSAAAAARRRGGDITAANRIIERLPSMDDNVLRELVECLVTELTRRQHPEEEIGTVVIERIVARNTVRKDSVE